MFNRLKKCLWTGLGLHADDQGKIADVSVFAVAESEAGIRQQARECEEKDGSPFHDLGVFRADGDMRLKMILFLHKNGFSHEEAAEKVDAIGEAMCADATAMKATGAKKVGDLPPEQREHLGRKRSW
jgi:hypothetical protein